MSTRASCRRWRKRPHCQLVRRGLLVRAVRFVLGSGGLSPVLPGTNAGYGGSLTLCGETPTCGVQIARRRCG
jgi:hypothetical protein